MAVSLIQAAQEHANNGDYRKAGITAAFAAATPLLTALPMFNMSQGAGASYSWIEEGVMATAAFRALNSSYTAGEDKSRPRSVPLKIAGGTCQVDRAIVATMGEQVRTARIMGKVKAVSQMVGYKLIHGDAGSTAEELDGLVNRFAIGGSRAVANTSAPAALSMKKLDEALDETEGRGTHILLNRATARNITAYLRGSGTAVEIAQDAFGNQVQAYAGKPFIIADPVNVDSAYRALPFTEASSTCSLFVLNLGLDQLHGVSGPGGLAIEDIGVSDTGILRGHLIEWLLALADEGPRCVTRLTGITDATAVA
jgi:hypothetical protein